jgi:hypothetical protein
LDKPLCYENSKYKGIIKIVTKIENQKSEYIKSKNELMPYPRRRNGSSITYSAFSGIGIPISFRIVYLKFS